MRFRCSSLGKLMTAPTAAAAKAGEILSVGAKTFIRDLVAQDIFGVEFIVTSKYMEKGTRCEADGIALLNRVRGLDLAKNTERKWNDYITGEADLWDADRKRGHDIKCAWSAATFPILASDAEDKEYEWQMRGYMALWDADEWEVDHVLVDTPDDLIGYEPMQLHIVGHIPEHRRLTSWTVKRCADKEALMIEKIKAARAYYAEVVAEFERQHQVAGV